MYLLVRFLSPDAPVRDQGRLPGQHHDRRGHEHERRSQNEKSRECRDALCHSQQEPRERARFETVVTRCAKYCRLRRHTHLLDGDRDLIAGRHAAHLELQRNGATRRRGLRHHDIDLVQANELRRQAGELNASGIRGRSDAAAAASAAARLPAAPEGRGARR